MQLIRVAEREAGAGGGQLVTCLPNVKVLREVLQAKQGKQSSNLECARPKKVTGNRFLPSGH